MFSYASQLGQTALINTFFFRARVSRSVSAVNERGNTRGCGGRAEGAGEGKRSGLITCDENEIETQEWLVKKAFRCVSVCVRTGHLF